MTYNDLIKIHKELKIQLMKENNEQRKDKLREIFIMIHCEINILNMEVEEVRRNVHQQLSLNDVLKKVLSKLWIK